MKRLILILCTVFSISGYAQKADEMAIYKVHLSTAEKSIIAEIRPAGRVRAETGRTYYWFGSNTIKQTQGSYSGHLLNGPYKEFYPNKNLKEQGEFNKGLKTGVWKSWNPQGILVQQITWNKGLRSGAFIVYDDQGKLKQQGNYKNDSVAAETKPAGFWRRVNIFKKKAKRAEP